MVDIPYLNGSLTNLQQGAHLASVFSPTIMVAASIIFEEHCVVALFTQDLHNLHGGKDVLLQTVTSVKEADITNHCELLGCLQYLQW